MVKKLSKSINPITFKMDMQSSVAKENSKLPNDPYSSHMHVNGFPQNYMPNV